MCNTKNLAMLTCFGIINCFPRLRRLVEQNWFKNCSTKGKNCVKYILKVNNYFRIRI